MAGHLADILPLHTDGSLVHVIEPHQQVNHRGFAAAGGAHNGNALSGLYIQIQMLDQPAVRHIGEGNILNGQISLHMLQYGSIFRLRNLGHFLNQLKNPCRTGQSVL